MIVVKLEDENDVHRFGNEWRLSGIQLAGLLCLTNANGKEGWMVPLDRVRSVSWSSDERNDIICAVK
jgi:hypothetical protein